MRTQITIVLFALAGCSNASDGVVEGGNTGGSGSRDAASNVDGSDFEAGAPDSEADASGGSNSGPLPDATPPPSCGDDICGAAESCVNCVADCGIMPGHLWQRQL